MPPHRWHRVISIGTKDYRRSVGVSGALAGMVAGIVNFIQGDVVLATILLMLGGSLLGLVIWLTRTGRVGVHTSHAEAQATADDSDVIVYWRPGCAHCDRLRLGLGRARRHVSWVNILDDPAAAHFVATYHGGSTTVPTAVSGAGEMIEATPAAIRARIDHRRHERERAGLDPSPRRLT